MRREATGILFSTLLFVAGCASPQETLSTTVPLTPPTAAASSQTARTTPIPFTLPTAAAWSAPVWQGLTPGKSTQQDVDEYLTENAPDAKNYGVHGCRSYRWNTPGHTELSVEGGVLVYIQAPPPSGTTLRQLVDRYGPPEYVESLLSIGPDGQFYILEVFYPKQGLAFRLRPDQKKAGQVDPDVSVFIGYYVTPGDLAHLLIARKACYSSDTAALKREADREATWVRPWTGFGRVEVVGTR